MDYMSVKDASTKFGISERRVQKLCEESRIEGAQMISNVWIIPAAAVKPTDERTILPLEDSNALSLNELCSFLSISTATGRNWLKLDKIKATVYHKNRPFFSLKYCEDLKEEISSGANNSLKSRRNKKYVSGSYLYRDYVSENSKNLQVVEKLLEQIESENFALSDLHLRALLAECSLQLIQQRYYGQENNNTHLLQSYLNKNINIGRYACLINDILHDYDVNALLDFSRSSFFDCKYIYEESEDIIGLLYISCKNIANRKATGAYYTPICIVKKLISNLFSTKSLCGNERILDPCSGSGNFLLQLPYESVENIYGIDIDEISVKLTRINMALKYPQCTMDILYDNFSITDYFYYTGKDFDYVIGNPPWGFDYSEKEKVTLQNIFKFAEGKTVESYDLFIEQTLNKLACNGSFSFVLPEAILNVKIHQPVRQLLVDSSSIESIDYLGNAFDKVQCPCVILQVKLTGMPMKTVGMKICTKDDSFSIKTDRKVSSEYFSFTILDKEYSVLQKIFTCPDCVFLKDNATFALGLVTGNNKKYISNEKGPEYEIVLKGSDIYKYKKAPHQNYIVFRPEEFQQVAPTEYYRADEKLLYRFICNQLVFAYDDKQTLSLNSCNILIPKFKSVNIKYIMAVLNSRIAQFLFSKQFQSVKVLRSHIEQIPIPAVEHKVQQSIIDKVDSLIEESDPAKRQKIYDSIDLDIASIFSLTEDDYSTVINAGNGENIFLM